MLIVESVKPNAMLENIIIHTMCIILGNTSASIN